MISSNDIGLVFRAKGDTSDAKKAFNELSNTIDKDIAAAGGSLSSLAGPAAIAATAVAAIGTAAITAGKFLFDLAKSASDYGSKIKEASDQTGLAAKTLSALQLAADQSGSSLDQVTGMISKFARLVGDAAAGSDRAAAALARLGIDPLAAINDLDGSLERVFKRIIEAPPGVEQTKLAVDAFGKSGAEILPVLKSFDGDLEKLIDKAEELGATLDGPAVDAADEFGDTLDDLNLSVRSLGHIMANEFLPTVTSVMRDITGFISQNKAVFRDWGTAVRNIIQELREAWTWLASGQGQQLIQWIRLSAAISSMGLSEQIIRSIQQAGDQLTANPAGSGSMQARVLSDGPPTGGGGRRSGGGRNKQDETKKRELDARIQYFQNELSRLREVYRKELDALFDEFGKTGDAFVLDTGIKALNDKYVQAAADALQELGVLEDARIKLEKKTGEEIAVIQQERAERWQKIQDEEQDALKRAEEAKVRTMKKSSDEQKKLSDEEFRRKMETVRANAALALAMAGDDRAKGSLSEVDYQKRVAYEKLGVLEEEKKLLRQREQTAEVLQRIKIIDTELSIQQIENARLIGEAIDELNRKIRAEAAASAGDPGESADSAGEGGGGGGGWLSKLFGNFDFGIAVQKMTKFGDVTKEIGKVVTDVFQQMGAAVGNMVQNWVLLGSSADMSMKKMLASVLAGVAAQAATLSIFHLAMGLAALTPWGAAMYGPAPLHFKAAALWGIIAVGTALAGRAVAGDSFKKQTGGAYGTQTQSSSGSRGGNGGEVYSSRDKLVLDMARNMSGPAPGVTVAINDKTGLFGEFFSVEVGKNGLTRKAIREAIK